MCCRISPSHPATRIIAGLYILLATFLIGFFAVQVVLLLGQLAEPLSQRLLVSVQQPPTPGPDINTGGPLAIEYLYTKVTPDAYEAVFKLTNYGPEPIWFHHGDKSFLYKLHEGRLPGTIRVGSVGCEIGRHTLEPLDSTTISVGVEADDSAYFLSIRYFIDPHGIEQTAGLLVKRPHLVPMKYGDVF
jgi:hypothetical protein